VALEGRPKRIGKGYDAGDADDDAEGSGIFLTKTTKPCFTSTCCCRAAQSGTGPTEFRN